MRYRLEVNENLDGHSYDAVYSDCPRWFDSADAAQSWADHFNSERIEFGDTVATYSVVEIWPDSYEWDELEGEPVGVHWVGELTAVSMQHFHHLTITTGHSRRSYRDEVGDDIIYVCANLINASLDKGAVEIPEVRRMFECQRDGSNLGCAIYTMQMIPILTFGVALKARDGVRLWRSMQQETKQPQPPWIAVNLHDAAVIENAPDDNALEWAGDFERCVAWAWYEIRNKAH